MGKYICKKIVLICYVTQVQSNPNSTQSFHLDNLSCITTKYILEFKLGTTLQVFSCPKFSLDYSDFRLGIQLDGVRQAGSSESSRKFFSHLI